MKINKVTITGADDSIHVGDLVKLSERFPFVEWGILLSKNNTGSKRFPSEKWLYDLFGTKIRNGVKLNLSGHLCGSWVRDITFGNGFTFIDDIKEISDIFERVQLNFHAIVHKIEVEGFIKALKRKPDIQYIFQLDDVNNSIVDIVKNRGINCAALFDTSGGIGKLPKEWPTIKKGLYCGYAGGLSPDNLELQLYNISQVCGDEPIWIDVETHVRSFADTKFDLEKVTKFLEISEKYITK